MFQSSLIKLVKFDQFRLRKFHFDLFKKSKKSKNFDQIPPHSFMFRQNATTQALAWLFRPKLFSFEQIWPHWFIFWTKSSKDYKLKFLLKIFTVLNTRNGKVIASIILDAAQKCFKNRSKVHQKKILSYVGFWFFEQKPDFVEEKTLLDDESYSCQRTSRNKKEDCSYQGKALDVQTVFLGLWSSIRFLKKIIKTLILSFSWINHPHAI